MAWFFSPLILAGGTDMMADPQGRKWHDMISTGKGPEAAMDIIVSFGKGEISKAIFPFPGTSSYRGAWEETIKAADEANDPGRVTALIGYEWTSTHQALRLTANGKSRDFWRVAQPCVVRKGGNLGPVRSWGSWFESRRSQRRWKGPAAGPQGLKPAIVDARYGTA
jgi:uncharacterized protein DUF3604